MINLQPAGTLQEMLAARVEGTALLASVPEVPGAHAWGLWSCLSEGDCHEGVTRPFDRRECDQAMGKKIQIKPDFRYVLLPNGRTYDEGDQVILSDAHYSTISPGALRGVSLIEDGLPDPEVIPEPGGEYEPLMRRAPVSPITIVGPVVENSSQTSAFTAGAFLHVFEWVAPRSGMVNLAAPRSTDMTGWTNTHVQKLEAVVFSGDPRIDLGVTSLAAANANRLAWPHSAKHSWITYPYSPVVEGVTYFVAVFVFLDDPQAVFENEFSLDIGPVITSLEGVGTEALRFAIGDENGTISLIVRDALPLDHRAAYASHGHQQSEFPLLVALQGAMGAISGGLVSGEVDVPVCGEYSCLMTDDTQFNLPATPLASTRLVVRTGGDFAITFPGVIWSGGSQPAHVDDPVVGMIYEFMTNTSGASWYGRAF